MTEGILRLTVPERSCHSLVLLGPLDNSCANFTNQNKRAHHHKKLLSCSSLRSIPNRHIPIPNSIFHFPTYEQPRTKLCTQLHDENLTKSTIKYLKGTVWDM